MDLFDGKNLERPNKDAGKHKDFETGKLNIQVFSSADPTTHHDTLLHVKYLFQRMLPKMPKDYILRQVFDEHQCCMTLNERIEGKTGVFRIIGAVLFRPCFPRKLVEIVFLAVDSDYHVSGYGTFLFSCFKEICKLLYAAFFNSGEEFHKKNIIVTDLSIFNNLNTVDISELEFSNIAPDGHAGQEDVKRLRTQDGALRVNGQHRYTNKKNLYLLTYADNSAIGFFKKQGFTLSPRSTNWIGYIKDYDGGTLMECKVHKDINYLRKHEIIQRTRAMVFEKMKKVNDFHILKTPQDRKEMMKYRDILGPHRSNEMRSKREFLFDFLYFMTCSLQSHPSSWPFLEPVAEKDVPDYHEVIKQPMDMSLVMEKLKLGMYSTLGEFKADIYLMCNNCFSYNTPDTQYYKCAENIKNYFEGLIDKYAKTIAGWGFEIGREMPG